ncbi:hypothetical protein [Flavobacterium sp.]|uniref:hypothetical protein n=1 Tax=Flavobacterium sp. TaxID=239 RepID=UPI003C634809
MKNIYKTFALLAFILLTLSCENDGGDSKIATQYGAVINIQKLPSTDAFINLVSIENNENINLGVSIDLALGDIASIDVIGIYIKKDGTTLKGKFITEIKNLPYSINITQKEIIDAFKDINNSSDLQIGDKLAISAEITLKDGRKLNLLNDDGSSNFSPKIENSNTYKNYQIYNVSCPSSLGGTYEYSTTNAGEQGGYFTDEIRTGNVTFEDQGGGIYTISDITFGGWALLYGPSEGEAKGVKLVDICNTLSLTGTDKWGDIFLLTNLTINGNKMSFHWENDYGEYGDTTLKRTDGTSWPSLKL